VQSAEAKGDGDRLTGMKLVERATRRKSKAATPVLKSMDSEKVKRLIVLMLAKNYLRYVVRRLPSMKLACNESLAKGWKRFQIQSLSMGVGNLFRTADGFSLALFCAPALNKITNV